MGCYGSHELYTAQDCLVISFVGQAEEHGSRDMRLEALQVHIEVLAQQPNETCEGTDAQLLETSWTV